MSTGLCEIFKYCRSEVQYYGILEVGGSDERDTDSVVHLGDLIPAFGTELDACLWGNVVKFHGNVASICVLMNRYSYT